MPENIFISASLIKDYLDCPKKVHYRLNYPDQSIQSPEMLVGNIVHSAVEKYWNDKVKAFEYLKNQTMVNHLTPMHADKANLCLSNFFSYFANSPMLNPDDKIELRFKIPYMGSYIVGKMDRVSEFGQIIDWKTSASHTNNVSKDPQFIIYQYVYEQLMGVAPISVIRANLIDGSADVYSRDKILEYSIINVVIPSAIEDIRNNTLPPTGLFSGKCTRCPAKTSCWKDLGY